MWPSRAATGRRCSSPSIWRAWRSPPDRRAAPARWSRPRCCWRWANPRRWPAAPSASRSGAALPPPTSTRSPRCCRTSSPGPAPVRTAGRAEPSLASLLEQAAHHAGDAEGLADHLVVERLQRIAELSRRLVALLRVAVERPPEDVGEPRRQVLAQLLE